MVDFLTITFHLVLSTFKLWFPCCFCFVLHIGFSRVCSREQGILHSSTTLKSCAEGVGLHWRSRLGSEDQLCSANAVPEEGAWDWWSCSGN